MKRITEVAQWVGRAVTGVAYFLALIILILAMSIGTFIGLVLTPFVRGYQTGAEVVDDFTDRVAENGRKRRADARARK